MNCHPDRSVPGFPATQPSEKTASAPFRKERRMKIVEATKFNRKSGVAQWRDPRFHSTSTQLNRKPVLFTGSAAEGSVVLRTIPGNIFDRGTMALRPTQGDENGLKGT